MSEGFVDTQLAFYEDLDALLVRVHLLRQGVYSLAQVSHRIGHDDLRGEQLLLGCEQAFVTVNQGFERTLNSIDSARIAVAVGFVRHAPVYQVVSSSSLNSIF